MKLWWMVGLSLIAATATRTLASESVQPVKGPDGTMLALVIVCDSCQSPDASAKACKSGVQQGWLNGSPCGDCLLSANASAAIPYPYDVHITGKLVDEAGAPRKEAFVKMFLPNGWTVRTRSADDGSFTLMLGATEERKSKKPLIVDLGNRVDLMTGKKDYALYLMPESYKPCPPGAATPQAKKPAQPAGPKHKSKKH